MYQGSGGAVARAQGLDLGRVVREQGAPRDAARTGSRPLGPSKPRRVPWPARQQHRGHRARRASSASPASRARALALPLGVGARQRDQRRPAPGGSMAPDGGRRRRRHQVAHQAADQVEVEGLASSVRRRRRGSSSGRRASASARCAWPAARRRSSMLIAAGAGPPWSPLDPLGHQAVALGRLVQRAACARASAPGRACRPPPARAARAGRRGPGTSPPVTEMLRRNWSNQLTTRRLAHEVVHAQARDGAARAHGRVGGGHRLGARDGVHHDVGALARRCAPSPPP